MAKKPGGFNIKELVNAGAGPAMPNKAPTKKKSKKSKPSADVIGQPTPQMPPPGMGMGM